MNERVLITGSSGFVGSAIARRLADASYEVIGVSRHPDRRQANAWPVRQMPRFDADDAAFDALLDGVDHVVHAAGLAHADPTIPERAYVEANTLLTARLAAAASNAAPGKFVFISSIRAQCGPVSQVVQDETSPAQPTDAYGRSKVAAEREVREAHRGREEHFTILRPTVMYGPHPKGNIAALLRLAATPLPLPFANLSGRRSLLNLDSLAQAVLHVLRNPATAGGVFVVSDDRPVNAAEILAAMRRGMSRPARLFALPQPFLDAMARAAGKGEAWRRLCGDLIIDPTHLRSTGWKASDTVEGLTSMAANYQRPRTRQSS